MKLEHFRVAKTPCEASVIVMSLTSISECLPPQDLPYDGRPHGLDVCSAGLEYKGVL